MTSLNGGKSKGPKMIYTSKGDIFWKPNPFCLETSCYPIFSVVLALNKLSQTSTNIEHKLHKTCCTRPLYPGTFTHYFKHPFQPLLQRPQNLILPLSLNTPAPEQTKLHHGGSNIQDLAHQSSKSWPILPSKCTMFGHNLTHLPWPLPKSHNHNYHFYHFVNNLILLKINRLLISQCMNTRSWMHCLVFFFKKNIMKKSNPSLNTFPKTIQSRRTMNRSREPKP